MAAARQLEAPRKWAAALLFCFAFLPGGSAWLCSMTHKDSVKYLPKGWRDAVARLNKYAGCGAGAAPKPQKFDESFLKGLEHPGSYFRVDINRTQNEKLGFSVTPKLDHLEVDTVQLVGAIPSWNEVHPYMAIAPRDCIVQVNGAQANGTIMADALRASPQISLRVFRASAEDREQCQRARREDAVRRILRAPPPSGLGGGIPEPAGSNVAVLHANNIDAFVSSQPVSLIMFYANWCGHCRQVAPDFTRAAELVAEMGLPTSVRLAKYDDGDAVNSAYGAGSSNKFNFTSYPSFVYCKDGKHEGFYGADGAQEIAAQVAARVNGQDIASAVEEVVFNLRPMMYRPDVDGEVVLDLEPETFDDIVLKNYPENNRVWIIEFYSDKCPFCKSLKPEVVKASEQLRREMGSDVRLAAVNSRAFGLLAKRFEIGSYPWVTSIYAGRKLDDMAGLGGADSIVKWAKTMHSKEWRKVPKWSETMPEWPVHDKKAEGEDMMPDTSGTWRELLGRRTWFFLHTYAAKFPEEPTKADRAAVVQLIATLGQHYPCPICRTHLREKLMEQRLGMPPTSSREELVKWFCKLHNMVNKDLNKTMFKCNAFELDLKYLKSCGECSAKGPALEDESVPGPSWEYFAYLERAAAAAADGTAAAGAEGGKVLDEL